jgi:pimeloyl-ACP methyl ester carboxylesterase
MPYVTTTDGAQIFYKDWGEGRPVVLSHGWPLSSDSWEAQQLYPGAPHCITDTHKQQLSDDLLAFLRSLG